MVMDGEGERQSTCNMVMDGEGERQSTYTMVMDGEGETVYIYYGNGWGGESLHII